MRYERFDVTLFQDKLRLSITHEQVQEVLFPDCIARPDAGRQYEGGMWTLKWEAYGSLDCDYGCDIQYSLPYEVRAEP